ncbi:response regulator transcription factor [Gracilibacillus oryzae]|uniref:Response regulator transcription factor n=1 Tax=Gracilibacillus oryzae TaxID=1672701 RepID=A0A7C8GQS2_9BACI|nr:response regulator transcription factor [Gracilibacillus oryzae]KAB8126177.1 response regulator transcription factor [Gracilibacillus oryzae]
MAQVILIVDDDKDICNMIELYLTDEGYHIVKANDGLEAMDLLAIHPVDLVILDIMLPKLDGIEVCRRIREKNNLPIIMLSAKSADIDKAIGLSTGADDYIAKPFSPIEFKARVKAQLRRYTYFNNANNSPEQNVIHIRGLKIVEISRSVFLYDKPVRLTKTEYEILLLLARNVNTVFSLEDIFEKVWKENYYDGNNTVMVHIARLREKIEDNPKEPKIIKNVWGVGYKIEHEMV